MSVPPERISLKRRRVNEAVDYLRFDPTGRGKRRHTEYIFQREQGAIPPLPRKPSQSAPSNVLPPRVPATDSDGIPIVRATAPGDEIKELRKLRAAQKARAEADVALHASAPPIQNPSATTAAGIDDSTASALVADTGPQQNARRFHLTSDLTENTHKDRTTGSISKQSKSFKRIRPLLATFVERQRWGIVDDQTVDHNQSDNGKPVQDRQLNGILLGEGSLQHEQGGNLAGVNQPPPVMEKQQRTGDRSGQSMRDHPSTWDIESDQLADELAAFALELDPGTNHDPEDSREVSLPKTHQGADVPMMYGDEYVYDTYIRIPYDDVDMDLMLVDAEANVGILVIDRGLEDLWQEYLNEDNEDDDEWDEEDSNAEDNPANDYPEDEVDIDDERGHSAYKFRRHGSDDESYDEEYDD